MVGGVNRIGQEKIAEEFPAAKPQRSLEWETDAGPW
jgi:hypothetical protein